ncbi:hypothetical protein ACLOJK_035121, partial [Asimina triloba]
MPEPSSFCCLPSFLLILSFTAKILEKQLITSEDLDMIREGYGILSSIVLSAPAPYETSRDHHPGHLLLNECMLGAEVWIFFDFEVDEALWAFNVSLARVVPHSWKVIQTMTWFYERRGCLADRHLWRELLICRPFQGYAVFSTPGDVKAIDNTFDHHPLKEEFFHWCESVRFIAVSEEKKRAPKRVRSFEEGSISVDFDSSAKEAFEPSPFGGSPAAVERTDHRGVPSPQELVVRSRLEGMVPSSVVTQLREELEVSHAEVACLQSMLRGDDARSLAVAEYLQSAAYRRR